MEKETTRRDFFKTTGGLAAGAALTLIWKKWAWAARAVNTEIFKKKIYMGLRGLAEYPFFEMTETGRLRLTVDGLEGGIDGHTHLALNSLMGGAPDLLKPWPQTRYYLPPDVKSSLSVYANQNNGPEDKKAMGRTVMKTLLPGGAPVTETHTIPDMLAEMDLLGIEKAVVLPICFGWPFGMT